MNQSTCTIVLPSTKHHYRKQLKTRKFLVESEDEEGMIDTTKCGINHTFFI